MTRTLRVRAVGDGLLPLIHPDGGTVMGRYCGRDRDGKPLAAGELVPADAYHLRAIAEGALVELDEDGEPKESA
jgi:hypothetical protein